VSVGEPKASPTGETPDARALVFARLSRQMLRYPDLAIEPFEDGRLTAREQAFARAMEVAAIGRWRTLETILATRLRKPWGSLEPKVRGALMGGAAQLLFMDRVPDHAAVAETVSWAKRTVRPGAGKLVNGVLRAVTRLRKELLPATDPRSRDWWDHRDVVPLETGEALLLDETVFSGHTATRLAEQASLCDELIDGWIRASGWENTQLRAHHCLARPPLFLHEGDTPGRLWTGSHDELVTLLARNPEARVQDPGSARVVEATRTLSPGLIVDFCAGRGTKTRQLASLHPEAEILATDVNESRMTDLLNTFEGHDRIRAVRPNDLRDVIGTVDLLVLDVPCSNTGVLPRRSQARYRLTPRRQAGLSKLQKGIVTDTVPLLAPGAHLLYSTCSLEPGENERIARWIESRYEVITERTGLVEPAGRPGDDPGSYSDGGFHALFRGRGDAAEESNGSEGS